MDKLYTDFAAGAYNSNNIFLQADPITGALTKVNLPAQPPNGIIKCIINQAGTASPVITSVINTTTVTLSPSRIATGMYNIVASAAIFNTTKTIILSAGSNANNQYINFQIQSSTSLFIFQFTNLAIAVDNLNKVCVSIEFY